MHLTAWLYPNSERSREELVRAARPEECQLISARYGIAVGSQALERVLAAAEAADGLGVSAGAVLSEREMALLPYRELACRNTASETDRDYDRNSAACTSTPLRSFGAEEPIRLVRGFSLSRIRIKPNAVAAIGDWTNEYILGAAVQHSFAGNGLSGYSLVPVENPKLAGPWQDFAQLYSSSVLPKSVRDASIDRVSSRVESENGKLRQLGCLAYDPADMRALPDFNRTAEPWMGWWGWPSWVVSARVERVFRQQKLRGWAFRPVFVVGTTLYQEYREGWHRLRNLVSKAPKSSFEGGRW